MRFTKTTSRPVALALATAAAAAVSAAPVQAADPGADAPRGVPPRAAAAASAPEGASDIRSAGALVRGLALRERLMAMQATLSPFEELLGRLDLREAMQMHHALDAATGGEPGHPAEQWQAKLFGEDEEGAFDWLLGGEGAIAAMGTFAASQPEQTNAAHEGPSGGPGFRGRSMPGWITGPGSPSDGTMVGGDGRDANGAVKKPYEKDKVVSEGSYYHEDGNVYVTEREYADGRYERRTARYHQERGTLIEAHTVDDGEYESWHYIETSDEAIDRGEAGDVANDMTFQPSGWYRPDRGDGEDPDEQPNPEGGTGPKRKDCVSLPTSRDECRPGVSSKQLVSQPGRGDEQSGASAGRAGAILAARDWTSQPIPEEAGHVPPSQTRGPQGSTCTVCIPGLR